MIPWCILTFEYTAMDDILMYYSRDFIVYDDNFVLVGTS